MTVITLGYLGWIAFVVRGLLTQFGGIESKKKLGIFVSTSNHTRLSYLTTYVTTLQVSVVALGILVMIVLALDKAPILYYLYVAMPTFFWATVLSDTRALGHVYKLLSSSSSLRWSSAGILLAAIIVAEVSVRLICRLRELQSLANNTPLQQVLGFFWRQVFCVCFIGMSIWGWKQHGIRKNTRLAWSTLCFILSLFPLIPIDAGSFLAAVYDICIDEIFILINDCITVWLAEHFRFCGHSFCFKTQDLPSKSYLTNTLQPISAVTKQLYWCAAACY